MPSFLLVQSMIYTYQIGSAAIRHRPNVCFSLQELARAFLTILRSFDRLCSFTLSIFFIMAQKPSFFFFVLVSFLFPFNVLAQTTTNQTTTASAVNLNVIIPLHVYPPLTVTGHFPCLTANSYMILTDSQSSSATYPVWICTSDCVSPSSGGGVGLMVFPATTTTGAYEVQNPPSGYPALKILNPAVITDSAFSTDPSINVQ